MEANQLGRLQDLLGAARLIARYVRNTTAAEFMANSEKQDAVIRRIEIIGEAAAHLNEDTRQAIHGLPFRTPHPPDFSRIPIRTPFAVWCLERWFLWH